MKKYLSIIFLLTFLVSGCNNHGELENPNSPSTAKVFTASFEQNESRTYLENDELFWNAGDLITIFDGLSTIASSNLMVKQETIVVTFLKFLLETNLHTLQVTN